MLQLATVTAGSRFQLIPRNEGFVFHLGRKVVGGTM